VPQTRDRASREPTVRHALEAPAAPRLLEPSADVTERFARGAAVAYKLHEVKAEGYTPDVVVAHPGWGESLFVRDVWPSVRVVADAEFFYTAISAGFDPEFTGAPPPLFGVDLRIRNIPMTLALLDADIGVAPTPWQASAFPEVLRSRLSVVHEGIDTDLIAPRPGTRIPVRNGPAFTREDEIVTFVNRNLEPHRGFHTFMRALPARRPKAHVIMVGGAGDSHGPPPRSGASWKDVLLRELDCQLDLSRIHFVGRVPYRCHLRPRDHGEPAPVGRAGRLHRAIWSASPGLARAARVDRRRHPAREVAQEVRAGWEDQSDRAGKPALGGSECRLARIERLAGGAAVAAAS
jgi:hypothetical protein